MNYLKKNLIGVLIMLVIGTILLVRALILKFPDGYIESSLFGLGCGLFAAGIGSTIVTIRTLRNPSKIEEIEIDQKDERNVLIREKTNSRVYTIFIYVETLLIIISMLLNKRDISLLLSGLVIAKLVVWAVICNDINKKY
ncbi:MAG: DUF2178 domain-containing protein [Clostridioides difficile]|nr:DUF2178 domain-containing protein [Clostridioides sp.]MBS5787219.1 DUF2178 domain-containing protein [Clostridioides difficile]